MLETLLQSSYFALFLIIALGFILGRIQIKGLSLDVSAVIFIALLFGHFGVIIPKELGNFGLVLFIFTIGIQAGPGFFDSFRSKGKTLIILTLLIVGSASLTGLILKYVVGIDTPSLVGLIAGALTSTPGLAVAIDSTHSSSASIAYGIAYPFGVIGVILFIKLLPKLLRKDIIAEAKARGVDVTCETAPHYLIFKDEDLQEDGRFKMNPPIRSEKDREALRKGILDGTIDMIATDHAPHSWEEKSKGLSGSAMGIVGLETAFPLLYTELVKPGVISMERLMELLHDAPCRRFNIPTDTGFTVFDLNDRYRIDPADFLSMGKATPFTGWEAQGRCLLTAAGETAAWYDADRLLKGE